MILSGEKIKKYIQEGVFRIEPFTESNVKEASYTFTLSSKILRLADNQILRADIKPQYEEFSIFEEGYTLQPGEFVLGFTRERLKLNRKYACLLSARSSCAKIGLNILLGSIFAEPDSDNPQTLEIVNVGKSPIILFPGMPIVKGIFISME